MLALIAAATLAGSPAAAADSNPDAGSTKPDKIVCKSFPKSDTRIGVNRVCKPRSEERSMMRITAWVIAASLAMPGSALAAAPQQAKGGKPDKVICKSFQKTQSRIGVVRICKPRSEWEYEQREQEIELDQIKSENTINLPPDTNPF